MGRTATDPGGPIDRPRLFPNARVPGHSVPRAARRTHLDLAQVASHPFWLSPLLAALAIWVLVAAAAWLSDTGVSAASAGLVVPATGVLTLALLVLARTGQRGRARWRRWAWRRGLRPVRACALPAPPGGRWVLAYAGNVGGVRLAVGATCAQMREPAQHLFRATVCARMPGTGALAAVGECKSPPDGLQIERSADAVLLSIRTPGRVHDVITRHFDPDLHAPAVDRLCEQAVALLQDARA